ncbi:MAG TPA: hypothetical protein VK686_21215 [Bryobacteraceae bacterium]|jgi:hypothetical protein|nr:hypothetical protein [Bryobacteraceae bacterium]
MKRLHGDDDPRGVITEHAGKLRDILARLDAARVVTDPAWLPIWMCQA